MERRVRNWGPVALGFVLSGVVLAVGAVGYYQFSHEVAECDAEAAGELTAIVDLRSDEVAQWVRRRFADAEALHTDRAGQAEIRRVLGNPAGTFDSRATRRLDDFLKTHRDYSAIAILNANGKVLAQAGRLLDRDEPAPQSVRKTIETNQVWFEDLHRNKFGAAPVHLGWYVPVRLRTNGPPDGVILLLVDPTVGLYPVLRQSGRNSTETNLLHRGQNEVVILDPPVMSGAGPWAIRESLSKRNSVAAAAVQERGGTLTGMDYRGVPVLAIARKVPGTPWVLMSKRETAEIRSSAFSRELVAAVFALLVVLAASIGVVFWRNHAAGRYRQWFEAERRHSQLLERYECLSLNASDAIILFDEELRVVEANERAAQLYGYDRAGMAGMRAADLRAPSQGPTLTDQFQRARMGGSSIFESVDRRHDGTEFPVETSTKYMPVQGTYCFQCIIRDITGRVQMERSLKESELRYRRLFNSISDAIFVYPAGLKACRNNFIEVNDVACRRFGYSREEFLHLSLADLDHSKTEDPIAIKVPGRMSPDGSSDWESVFICRDGRSVPVQIHISTFNLEDKPVRIAVVRDLGDRVRSEDELRRREEEYRTVLSTARDAFWSIDGRGRFLDVNNEYCRVSGYSREELLRMSVADMDADTPEVIIAASFAALMVSGSGRFEVRHRCKDGRVVDLELSVVYLRSAAKFLVFGRDVSHRKRFDRDREASLTLLRMLNSPSQTDDLIRKVTDFLQRWSGLTAVGIRMVKGDSCAYYESRGPGVEPFIDERPCEARSSDASRGGPVETDCLCVKLFEESAAHRVGLTGNGSFVTNHASLSETSPESTGGPRLCIRAVAGGYQSIALIPLRFGDGLLGVLQCGDTGQDRLTPDLIAFLERSAGSIATALEQQKAQAALATSEERLRLISEYTADVIWVADLRTRQFTYVSPSVTRARGYTPEELVNQHVLSLASSVAPEAREHVLGEIERHAINFASGVASTATFTLLIPQIQKDCSIVPTETALTFLPGPDGRPREILGVSRDITERVRAEREKASLLEELRQAQKLESIGRLAGGIAHDFNNLLTVINGNSSLAAEALPADGLLAELVGEISQAGVRAAGLTQQLLAFSRKELAEPTVVSLNRQIIEIRDVFQRLLGEDIELVTDLQDDLWPVLADPGHIHQVLLNLGVNSRDAMPRGGVLTFRTSNTILDAVPGVASGQDSNEFVMLEVSDTGVGIEPSVAGRVFEPFFTTKHDKGGTGLGLSTVYGIVRQCQGWIRLRSEPGVGTTFIILLPRAVDPYEAELLIAAESSAHLHGSETILVAEDQGQVRKITGLILKKHGYRVYLAASGPEALSFAAEFSEPIDLLVTDIVMPGMNGFELADRLRALRPGIRTLYTSGYPDKVADLQGISPTALRYLPKPFTAQSLVTMVREALAGGGVGRAPSPDPLVRLPKG